MSNNDNNDKKKTEDKPKNDNPPQRQPIRFVTNSYDGPQKKGSSEKKKN